MGTNNSLKSLKSQKKLDCQFLEFLPNHGCGNLTVWDLNISSRAKTLQKFQQFYSMRVLIRINMNVKVPDDKKRISTQKY